MDTLIFTLYAVIFICIWCVFNQYFKDHSHEKRQPIRINTKEFMKEHFAIDKLSVPSIRNMVQSALGQLENTNNNKPSIEPKNDFKTDMELYLIGPNKDTFYNNLRENRKNPTNATTIKACTMEDYFGTTKQSNNLDLGQLL